MPRLRSKSWAERDSSGGGGGADLTTTVLPGEDEGEDAGTLTGRATASAGSGRCIDAYTKTNPTARPARPTNARLPRMKLSAEYTG
jgi:hypothetical protein